jgi:hypothetical protein
MDIVKVARAVSAHAEHNPEHAAGLLALTPEAASEVSSGTWRKLGASDEAAATLWPLVEKYPSLFGGYEAARTRRTDKRYTQLGAASQFYALSCGLAYAIEQLLLEGANEGGAA